MQITHPFYPYTLLILLTMKNLMSTYLNKISVTNSTCSKWPVNTHTWQPNGCEVEIVCATTICKDSLTSLPPLNPQLPTDNRSTHLNSTYIYQTFLLREKGTETRVPSAMVYSARSIQLQITSPPLQTTHRKLSCIRCSQNNKTEKNS